MFGRAWKAAEPQDVQYAALPNDELINQGDRYIISLG